MLRDRPAGTRWNKCCLDSVAVDSGTPLLQVTSDELGEFVRQTRRRARK
jgi:hypothetical protein